MVISNCANHLAQLANCANHLAQLELVRFSKGGYHQVFIYIYKNPYFTTSNCANWHN